MTGQTKLAWAKPFGSPRAARAAKAARERDARLRAAVAASDSSTPIAEAMRKAVAA